MGYHLTKLENLVDRLKEVARKAFYWFNVLCLWQKLPTVKKSVFGWIRTIDLCQLEKFILEFDFFLFRLRIWSSQFAGWNETLAIFYRLR